MLSTHIKRLHAHWCSSLPKVSQSQNTRANMEALASKYNVANKLEKRSLLIAVNAVAALSIFFFGYDQGVMGGVNTTRNYAELMKFGHWDAAEGLVKVDHSLLQGGIVSVACLLASPCTHVFRSLSTICRGL